MQLSRSFLFCLGIVLYFSIFPPVRQVKQLISSQAKSSHVFCKLCTIHDDVTSFTRRARLCLVFSSAVLSSQLVSVSYPPLRPLTPPPPRPFPPLAPPLVSFCASLASVVIFFFPSLRNRRVLRRMYMHYVHCFFVTALAVCFDDTYTARTVPQVLQGTRRQRDGFSPGELFLRTLS